MKDLATKAPAEAVVVQDVVKTYGALTAVAHVSLTIASGTFFSLLGPSGCGKTTLLRLIAGFEQPDTGQIVIHGQDMTGLPAQKRPTAMVFQNYALFPTMTVGENVAYGLAVRKTPKPEIRQRVAEALARVDLAGLEEKPVTQLSGGQQQRVALARALAIKPEVILFDEPLSNLDVALREQTRRELKLLQHEVGTTSIYVTHDQQEALALSDQIAVMRAGEIQQLGTPQALYQAPETAFVAHFLGGSNIIADPALFQKFVPEENPSANQVLAVRPEHLQVAEAGDAGAVAARVQGRQFLGTHMEYWAMVAGQELRFWADPAVALPTDVFLKATAHRWVTASDDA